jgi:hypothetical protein
MLVMLVLFVQISIPVPPSSGLPVLKQKAIKYTSDLLRLNDETKAAMLKQLVVMCENKG